MHVKKLLPLLLGGALLLYAQTGEESQSGSYEAYVKQLMDENKKANESLIQENAEYYQEVVKEAYKQVQALLSNEWGKENVKLSNNTAFTEYSEDKKERTTVDFEKGTVTVEMVVDEGVEVDNQTLSDKLNALQEQSVSQALKKDPVASVTIKTIKKHELASPMPEKEEKSKFMKGYIEPAKPQTLKVTEKKVELPSGKKQKIISTTVPMVPNHLQKRAKKFESDVLQYAKKFNVEPSHIYGTIQTESYFNPLAISHVPAYGLMQIVPQTAGIDAYYALKKEKKLLPPTYLYDAQNNIELGTKYIEIIKYRYLRGVKNEESLFYCSAVAYNAGIGSLYRAFTGSKRERTKAIQKINSLSPEEVYTLLHTSKRLTEEARHYVKKMRNHAKNYKKYDLDI